MHPCKNSPFDSFLVMTLASEVKTMKDISPFYIKRELDRICGTVKNATRVRDGSLLIETVTADQSKKLLKATLLGSYPIRVVPHKSLNSCRGVVTTSSLDGLTNEEIVTCLSDQGVCQSYRLTRKQDGTETPLRTVFLTFKGTKLPEYIFCGYERAAVRPYIPNPMRCFQCQRFGHTKNACNHPAVCERCGLPSHDDTACTRDLSCVNYGGKHASSSRQCPKFLDEKCIQELRVKERLTFIEARRRFELLKPSTTLGYSSAARRAPVSTVGVQHVPVVDACTQTDLPASTPPQFRTLPAQKASSAVQTPACKPSKDRIVDDRSRHDVRPPSRTSSTKSRSRSASRRGSSASLSSEDSYDGGTHHVVGPKSARKKRKR